MITSAAWAATNDANNKANSFILILPVGSPLQLTLRKSRRSSDHCQSIGIYLFVHTCKYGEVDHRWNG